MVIAATDVFGAAALYEVIDVVGAHSAALAVNIDVEAAAVIPPAVVVLGDVAVDAGADEAVEGALGDIAVIGLEQLIAAGAGVDDVAVELPVVADRAAVVAVGHVDQLEVAEVALGELVIAVVVNVAVGAAGVLNAGSAGAVDDDAGVAGVDDDVAGGVLHQIGQEGIVGHLGHGVAVGAAGVAGDVVENAGVDGIGHGVGSPAGAGQALAVGVVAESDEEHLGKLVAGQLVIGTEGAVLEAVNHALADAVGYVARAPAVGGDVGEGLAARGEVVGAVAQLHAGDNGRGLFTAEYDIRLIGAVLVPVDDAECLEHYGRLLVRDFVLVGEVRARRIGEHAQDQRENQNEAQGFLASLHFGYYLLECCRFHGVYM